MRCRGWDQGTVVVLCRLPEKRTEPGSDARLACTHPGPATGKLQPVVVSCCNCPKPRVQPFCVEGLSATIVQNPSYRPWGDSVVNCCPNARCFWGRRQVREFEFPETPSSFTFAGTDNLFAEASASSHQHIPWTPGCNGGDIEPIAHWATFQH